MANPTDLINVAELGIRSGTIWGDRYQDLTVKNLNQADYLLLHQNLKTNTIAIEDLKTRRRQVTNDLKDTNKSVNEGVSKFKKLLSVEYEGSSLTTEYAQYGLKVVDNIYKFPTDNDERTRAIGALVAKLSEPNNPIANHAKYGLAFWIAVRQQHTQAWNSGKDLDGNISVLSRQNVLDKATAIQYQKRLRLQIRADYPDTSQSVLRDFGFQKEKY